jgi:hypothetical protein
MVQLSDLTSKSPRFDSQQSHCTTGVDLLPPFQTYPKVQKKWLAMFKIITLSSSCLLDIIIINIVGSRCRIMVASY